VFGPIDGAGVSLAGGISLRFVAVAEPPLPLELPFPLESPLPLERAVGAEALAEIG
jgi:hypothetical protein